MNKYIKKYFVGVGLFLVVVWIAVTIQNSSYLSIGKQSAAVIDLVNANSAKPTTGYAWNDNIGWINFAATTTTNAEGRVYVSDNKLYGYAWAENAGWISMNCENDDKCSDSNYGVTQNNKDGNLTGYAWGENIGWINFAPTGGGVHITTNGVAPNNFYGYAWGENIGWVNFSIPSPDNITTTWIKPGSGTNLTECTYTFSNWTTCDNNRQERTILSPANTANCLNSNNEPLIQACTTATTTATTTPPVNPPPATTTPPVIPTPATTTEVAISINPTDGSILGGQTILFTATVTGTTNKKVDWIILPIETIIPDFYGTITDAGLYTAPLDHVVDVTIVAKSQANPNKTAEANISVRLKYNIIENYVFKRDQDPGVYSEDVANLQDILRIMGLYSGEVGGFFGPLTEKSLMEYQRINGLTESGILNAETRVKLNGIEEVTVIPDEPPPIIPPVTPPANNNGQPNAANTNPSTDNGLSGLVTNSMTVLGSTTAKVFVAAQRIFESPAGDVTAKVITTAGVVGGGIAIFAINGAAIADILTLPFRLWGLLLSALGLRKRNRPWGTVYDSVTKQPIDPAYVTLTNVNTKAENTSITDLDGRYGFLVPPGKYTLIANKTNYTFPSQKLQGRTEDILYNNLYFGQEIETMGVGEVINRNIPLDPVKFDWNEFVKGEKKLMKFYSKRDKVIKIITDTIFRIGLVISLMSLFLVSAPYNYIILGLYVVLLVLRKFGLKQKALGSLIEQDGNPLSFAIIRVFSADLNIEITNKVADKIGRYFCLVNKGKYFVKVEKKNDDESYSLVYTSPAFEVKNGIINKNFNI